MFDDYVVLVDGQFVQQPPQDARNAFLDRVLVRSRAAPHEVGRRGDARPERGLDLLFLRFAPGVVREHAPSGHHGEHGNTSADQHRACPSGHRKRQHGSPKPRSHAIGAVRDAHWIERQSRKSIGSVAASSRRRWKLPTREDRRAAPHGFDAGLDPCTERGATPRALTLGMPSLCRLSWGPRPFTSEATKVVASTPSPQTTHSESDQTDFPRRRGRRGCGPPRFPSDGYDSHDVGQVEHPVAGRLTPIPCRQLG